MIISEFSEYVPWRSLINALLTLGEDCIAGVSFVYGSLI